MPNSPVRAPLVADALIAALSPAVAARYTRLEIVEETGSTNADLLATPSSDAGLQVRIAERQTAGRGRRARSWVGAPGAGLAFSVGTTFQGSAASLGSLPLVVGVACCTALRRLGYPVSLKWPNDLVHVQADGSLRKLGGILVELKSLGAERWWAVCGVGLNVLPTAYQGLDQAPMAQPATSLSELAEVQSRTVVLAALLTELQSLLDGGPVQWPESVEAGRAFDSLSGQSVQVLEPQREWSGMAQGWDEQGRLLVRDAQGVTQALVSAELSVRRQSGGEA